MTHWWEQGESRHSSTSVRQGHGTLVRSVAGYEAGSGDVLKSTIQGLSVYFYRVSVIRYYIYVHDLITSKRKHLMTLNLLILL